MLTIDLTEDAGRACYQAGYLAAETFIFEHTGRATKTQKGVHREFARLAFNEPRINAELRRFLPQAYDLKAICDYELGPDVSCRARKLLSPLTLRLALWIASPVC